MVTPVKKINFENVGKENMPTTTILAPVDDLVKPVILESTKTIIKPVEVAVTPASLKALEKEEPLLKENPHRFVLFPIKYNDVSHFIMRCAMTRVMRRVLPFPCH